MAPTAVRRTPQHKPGECDLLQRDWCLARRARVAELRPRRWQDPEQPGRGRRGVVTALVPGDALLEGGHTRRDRLTGCARLRRRSRRSAVVGVVHLVVARVVRLGLGGSDVVGSGRCARRGGRQPCAPRTPRRCARLAQRGRPARTGRQSARRSRSGGEARAWREQASRSSWRGGPPASALSASRRAATNSLGRDLSRTRSGVSYRRYNRPPGPRASICAPV